MFSLIKKYSRVIRIISGLVFILAAYITDIPWLYIGVFPLLSGITNICPMCIIMKRCSIKQK